MPKNVTEATSVRLNSWARSRLEKVFKAFLKAIKANPDKYPSLQGRRITMSDVIILMCERIEADEQH